MLRVLFFCWGKSSWIPDPDSAGQGLGSAGLLPAKTSNQEIPATVGVTPEHRVCTLQSHLPTRPPRCRRSLAYIVEVAPSIHTLRYPLALGKREQKGQSRERERSRQRSRAGPGIHQDPSSHQDFAIFPPILPPGGKVPPSGKKGGQHSTSVPP